MEKIKAKFGFTKTGDEINGMEVRIEAKLCPNCNWTIKQNKRIEEERREEDLFLRTATPAERKEILDARAENTYENEELKPDFITCVDAGGPAPDDVGIGQCEHLKGIEITDDDKIFILCDCE